MASKTVTDFANTVAVLNFPTADIKLCSIDSTTMYVPFTSELYTYWKENGRTIRARKSDSARRFWWYRSLYSM